MTQTTSVLRRQRGAVLPMLLVLIGAGLAVAAFTADGVRLKSNAAQLKRATDAAALAVAQERSRNPDANVQALAEQYIASNLGMDQSLARQQIGVRLTPVANDDGQGFRITATFRAAGDLLNTSAPVSVSSAAVARYAPLEVSLVLSNDSTTTLADMAALRQVSKDFIDRLFDNSAGRTSFPANKNVWVALVPFSQSVNVHDQADLTRINRWARPGGLTPRELRPLFNTGQATSLADRRFPDRRARLLCMFRGLEGGQNFFWDQQPVGQFGVYYRHDLPENGSPGAPPLIWRGPTPMFDDNPAIDTRAVVADIGCPNAALLPLSADRERLFARLDEMQPRFNMNYAIALGWGGTALAPAMRGAGGWGDRDLPHDFNDGRRENVKAIVMVAKIVNHWMDTDAYNHERLRGAVDGNGGKDFSRQRFLDLCRSYQQRRLHFHLVGIRDGSGDADDIGVGDFDYQAMPGLTICSGENGSLRFIDSTSIGAVQDSIREQLNRIADTLKRETSMVRLIE